MLKPCAVCSKPTNNKRCCSLSCSAKWMHSQPDIAISRAAKISKTLTGRIISDAARAKTSSTMKNLGIRPMVRGGNGTGPTNPESILMAVFPDAKWNHAIPTGKGRHSGFTVCYKVDLAFPELKLAIELDGSSHQSRKTKSQDIKKEWLLGELGWTVLRFRNNLILGEETRYFAVESIIEELYRLSALHHGNALNFQV